MTEKRFYLDKDGVINDREYEFSLLGEDELVDIINSIVDENEQLKSDNKCYVKRYSELFDDYIAYKKENEQLKQQIDEMITIFENSGLDYHISDELNEILNR